ncbi:pentatricopeptide repeat-containing protein At3g20730-like [Amborella trichopoda]|uniref:pentatricopeptide repeat-containing protein At3g20730-like n=1 Tax=Amborella trichopoda TaxID=13333 RepID=UPI0005D35451|nr:pentatricopeptide repeat-containing protein At3g20730-like [Amborella trichopoda]|eukprot:XP_011623745.1 pentatricopeptide repeat-containing protein At3g20730-like [Amborella trichopoda]
MGYFQLMKRNGMRPDVYTFVSVMSSLDGIASVDFGILRGCYYQNGFSEEAWELFCWLRREAMQPNSSPYTMILCSCTVSPEISEESQVHALLKKSGLHDDIFAGTALMDCYAKCGTMEGARDCFERMSQVNLISFNTLISGYSQNGRYKETLDVFSKMQELGTKPDRFTFSGLLNCFIDQDCSKKASKRTAKELNWILIQMLVSLMLWLAYSYRLFARMRQVLRDFDEFTLSSLLKASLTLEQGRMLHASVIVSGLVEDEVVISDLIHLYTRNKCIEDAVMVYNTISDRNEMV